MIFNGISKDYLKVRAELFRPPTPPIWFKRNPLKDGARVTGKQFEDMTLPIPVTIMSEDNIEFLKEDISNWLYHEEPKELRFKQIPDRFYLAEYDSMELDEIGNYASGFIYFYLAQGFRYSDEVKLNVDGKLTSENLGQLSTPWTSKTTFTANQSSYEFQFNAPDKTDLRDINKIKLNYNFIAGDILEVDYSKRKAMLNGNDITSSLVILQSNFMELPIKNVEFTASHKTDIIYNERYY